MARPLKQGLDYFSFDVDFFDNRKIRKIMRSGSPATASILTCLLCHIYGKKGYYIAIDEDLSFDIADKLGVTEAEVNCVIKHALNADFFDYGQYEKNNILTSEEIQNRYKAGTSKRSIVVINPVYEVSTSHNPVIDTGNSEKGVDNTQSKVKESKVKESNNNGASAPDKKIEFEKRKKVFTESLIPYVKEFGKEMVRAFFDYWSEPNKSQTKMRWELQVTWDLKKRLERWRLNNDKSSKGSFENNAPAAQKKVPATMDDQINYLFGRYQEGADITLLIKKDHYDHLTARGFIKLGSFAEQEGETFEQKEKNAVLNYFKQLQSQKTMKHAS